MVGPIERSVARHARELGREPFDLRRQNIVTAAELPYRTAAGLKLDTGDYVAALDIARDKIDLPAIRKRQAAGEPDVVRVEPVDHLPNPSSDVDSPPAARVEAWSSL